MQAVWDTTVENTIPAPPASPAELPRALAIKSNSSKNITQGAAAQALSKTLWKLKRSGGPGPRDGLQVEPTVQIQWQ